MAFLRVRSLFVKAFVPTVVLVLTSMGAVYFLAVHAMSDGVRSVAEERARYGLSQVRSSVEGEMLAHRSGRLQEVLESLGRNPDVDALRILSATGKVLFASKPAEVGEVLPTHVPSLQPQGTAGDTTQVRVERPDLLHAASPIFNQPPCRQCHTDGLEVLGFADVDISLSRQSAGIRTWGALATTAALAQLVVIGLGIALILSLVVVKPLERLSESMQQLQHGNLDVSTRPSGTAEIDGLVDGFNDMAARLRRARKIEEDAQRTHLTRVEQLASIGEMAASLAHEIRNPLSGTRAAIDVLAAEEQAEEPRRILRHVSEELSRVDGVVRQLLNYARPKAPVLARVDLRSVAEDAVMLARAQATAQGATLEVSSRDHQWVRADADMVQQVIVNLVINALQASGTDAGATVTLSTGLRDGQASCSVRDTGPGVAADRAERIFRPFETTKARGTGLGLATSRRLIELQGGQLWLENPGEPGACFTFTLPLAENGA